MKTKLTLDVVGAIQPGQTVWDTEVRGLGIRRQRRDGWTRYVLRYDFKRRRRWYTIGVAGSPWIPKTARDRARELLVMVSKGTDPAAVRDAERGTPTVSKFSVRWLKDHIEPRRASSTVAAYRAMLERSILPRIGSVRLDDLTHAEVNKLHVSLRSTPIEANRMLALLSSMYTRAERWGVVPKGTNPCKGIERFRERKHQRFLDEDELARVAEAMDQLERKGLPDPKKPAAEREYVKPSPRTAGALRLLIFTGARPDEICSLKRDYIDARRGLARLPDSKTGPKVIRLNGPALAIIEAQPQLASSPYVFPAGGRLAHVGGHISNLTDAWHRVRAAAGLTDVRLYDLRHTFAAAAAGANYSLRIIGGLLGHTQPSTTQRYAHLADDPLRRAAKAVGKKLERALSGKKT